MIIEKQLLELLREGYNIKELANVFNCHKSTVRRYLAINNLKILEQPSKTRDFLGKTFGKLKVLKFSHYGKASKHENSNTGKKSYWECICECGKTVIVENSNLLNTKSCGCSYQKHLKSLHEKAIKIDAPFQSVLKEYKNGARDRLFEWNITDEEFKNITSSNCFYCDEKPSKIRDRNGRNIFKGEPYTYNGIDRVDNKKGYNKDNIVPCCFMCNMMKGNFSQKDFLNKIQQIKAKLSTGLV